MNMKEALNSYVIINSNVQRVWGVLWAFFLLLYVLWMSFIFQPTDKNHHEAEALSL